MMIDKNATSGAARYCYEFEHRQLGCFYTGLHL